MGQCAPPEEFRRNRRASDYRQEDQRDRQTRSAKASLMSGTWFCCFSCLFQGTKSLGGSLHFSPVLLQKTPGTGQYSFDVIHHLLGEGLQIWSDQCHSVCSKCSDSLDQCIRARDDRGYRSGIDQLLSDSRRYTSVLSGSLGHNSDKTSIDQRIAGGISLSVSTGLIQCSGY